MEIIKIFLLCGMKQSLCPILEKTMSPMGLPATLKHRCKGLQAYVSSVRKQTFVPGKWQGPRCVNSILYIPLSIQTVFKTIFLD